MERGPELAMRFWLGKAARKARDDTGLIRSEIAGAVPVDVSVIYNFERGESWPQQLQRILEVYVEKCGLEDETALWELAAKMRRETSNNN